MTPKPSVLFVNQHYYPDLAATAQMLTDLCEYLAADGFDVHVLCSRGHYLSGSMQVPKKEVHNGVHIHRVRATAFGRNRVLGRLTDYASFYAGALVRLLTGPSYDYVVTLTTPPLLSVAAALMKQLKGQRYGIWSMDLHPDAEIASGMFRKGGLLARGLHALNDAGYRNADFVVDLGRHMKRRLMDRGMSSEKLHTIPVWGKKEDIEPIPHDENPLRAELGLEDKFVVMYSGNAGVAHRFDEVLALMKQLDGHPHIRFVFVGEGPQKERIEAFAEDEGLSNFQYLPYFPREDLKYSLSLADVHLLTLREAMAGIAVPGKLYGIMAAGRPVLMVGPEASESAETIRECEAGRVVDPSEHDRRDACVETLRNALFSLYSQKRYRQELGRRGREAFLAEYERDVACEEWSHLLQDVVRAKRRKESRVQTAAAG